jgi:putative phage-type endonuclease
MARKLINTKEISHDEWLALRKKSLGGSDAGTCVGMNQYSSLLTLYADKKGLSSPVEDNEAMRLGRDLEQYVADRFMEVTGKKLVNDNFFYLDDEYDFISANVDRRVVGENAGFEAKTMGSFAGYNIEAGEVPSHYYAQCQHYCMVRGWDLVYIGILVLQRGFYWLPIKRDDEFIKTLREAEIDFWTNYVQKGRMPEPDGSDSSLDTLKELYPDASKGTEITVPGLDSLIRDYKAQKAMADEYKEKAERSKAIICSRLGTAEAGIGLEYGCSWKNQSKTSIDEKRLKAEHPEIYKQYAKVSDYRVFRTKTLGKKKGA